MQRKNIMQENHLENKRKDLSIPEIKNSTKGSEKDNIYTGEDFPIMKELDI